MKAHLLYRDADLDLEAGLPPQAEDVTQDLELTTLFAAMAGSDPFLHEVVSTVVRSGLDDPEAIRYRQRVLGDCLAHPDTVRELYGIVVDAIGAEHRIYGWTQSPASVLHRSVEAIGILVDALHRLRGISDVRLGAFSSEGFTTLFRMLRHELDDAYFREVGDHLKRLTFGGGVLMSARLGQGCVGTGHVLRERREEGTWLTRRLSHRDPHYSFRIADRDEAGFQALTELRGKAIGLAANALAQSADHIVGFLRTLRVELGFYLGCVNLHERLLNENEPTCFPDPVPTGDLACTFSGLYDVCLALTTGETVVGNDLDADGKALMVVTGANQGGKSTFLRSRGLAQTMMQAGMFVGAVSFRASVCTGLFTHYRREEDTSMVSGKFDEELARMSRIADAVRPGGMVLFTESFAATNEREGSQIAREIVHALLDAGVTVVFVTHQFDLAHSLCSEKRDDAIFLRAGREKDGRRTFRLTPGEPLSTSFGADLYRRIFVAKERPSTDRLARVGGSRVGEQE